MRYLNYKGDTRAATWPRGTVGPTTEGEYLVAVEATYDEEKDTTRVGFLTPVEKKEMES